LASPREWFKADICIFVSVFLFILELKWLFLDGPSCVHYMRVLCILQEWTYICRYIWRKRTIPVGGMFVKSLLRMSVWLLSREWMCAPIKRVSVWSPSRVSVWSPSRECLCDPRQESVIVIPDKNICKKIKEETAYDPYRQKFQPLAIIVT
jgi:hypothetical protein